ncbi:MAG TPA: phosphate acyltransferase [Bacillota bacterium]
MIKSFDALKKELPGSKPLRLVVVAAQETVVLDAVSEATKAGWVKPIFITTGEVPPFNDFSDLAITIHHASSLQQAAELGTELLARGEADLMMKGLIPTADFLRPLLNTEKHLIKTGRMLTHVGAISIPNRGRLTLISDAAIMINPDLRAKEIIIENAICVARALGYNPPKVAVLSALEAVNPKIPSSVEAGKLKEMSQSGRFGDCVVSGPLALDNALCHDAAVTKGLNGDPVAGEADVLIFPELVSGNILYKSFSIIAGYPSAGVVMGAKVPIILTSRADPPEAKVNSIALACFLAQNTPG